MSKTFLADLTLRPMRSTMRVMSRLPFPEPPTSATGMGRSAPKSGDTRNSGTASSSKGDSAGEKMGRNAEASGGEGMRENVGGVGGNVGGAMTVSQVAELVRAALASHAPRRIRIVGEISNLSARTHWFFNLKDDRSSLRCVCFASSAKRVRFDVHDGMEVVGTGRLDYYDAQGNVQFYVESIEPVGIGPLELQFRQLCETLRGLGYFEVGRKKALPLMARRVAVVTSRKAAALQDVINTASKRWSGCELVLVDVMVQGPSAGEQIAAAIRALSRDGAQHGIDAILLTRGGGSIEDLWAFNERVVADAVFECALPIVAAIGHETDTTIAELVADRRCATPTQAAMELVPDANNLGQQVSHLEHRLRLLLRRRVQHERQRLVSAHRSWQSLLPRISRDKRAMLERLAKHPFLRRPQILVETARRKLDDIDRRLLPMVKRQTVAQRDRLLALERELEAVGPGNVLRRGYSYTLDQSGQVIRSVAQAQAGAQLTTMLVDGKVQSTVDGAGPGIAGLQRVSNAVKKPRRRGRSKAVDASQLGLFGGQASES